MTVVVDASVIVAGLVDTGADGQWAERDIAGEALAAPHLLSVEVANVLRRVARSGELSSDIASLAHAELRDLRVEVFDDDIVASRVWQLRSNLTAYDAWYVAIAELLDVSFATLDRRLASAHGPRCEFLTVNA